MCLDCGEPIRVDVKDGTIEGIKAALAMLQRGEMVGIGDEGFLFLNPRALTDATSDPQIVWLDGWPEVFEARIGN